LLANSGADKPEHNLTGFEAAQCSPDARVVYFLTSAWVTSRALHAFDLVTNEERFVIDANCALVIPKGKHAGELLIERHRYTTRPNGVLRTYEWCGLVDSQGRERATLPETSCACDYATSVETRRRVDSALGI
jgi:hypothetical protein